MRVAFAVVIGAVLASVVSFTAMAAAPADFSGTRSVALLTPGGEETVIGRLRVERQGDGYRIAFDLDDAKFAERFLAMRPFRCLESSTVALCHFPYPGAGQISATDLTDLEYQLMFLRKPRAALSLDSRDGQYYELRWTEQGIDGVLRAVDMEPIIVPGPDTKRPIRREQLEPVDPATAWLPYLRIR
jgi:hypothetical protein